MSKDLSENELGKKFDRCIADAILKTAGGLAIGVITSVAILKGRTFPIWLGTGIGLGMGYSNCNHELQKPFILHGKKIVSDTTEGKQTYKIIIEQPTIDGSSNKAN